MLVRAVSKVPRQCLLRWNYFSFMELHVAPAGAHITTESQCLPVSGLASLTSYNLSFSLQGNFHFILRFGLFRFR